MSSHAWFGFTRVYLWFAVLVSSSVAIPNKRNLRLAEWIREYSSGVKLTLELKSGIKNGALIKFNINIEFTGTDERDCDVVRGLDNTRQCSSNCSCLIEKAGETSNLLSNCTTRERYTIDKRGNLKTSNAVFPQLNATPERRSLTCKSNLKNEKQFNYILLNLSCKGDRAFNAYVVYKQRRFTKLRTESTSVSGPDSLPPTDTTKHDEKKEDGKEPSKRLVIGLSIGVGLMVAVIVCWAAICWRRRRKKPDNKKQQDPVHGYIDEEEDSVPYRIVDLQTHISCDASGYTFLEAPKPEEEKPYQKLQPLQPKCSSVDKMECAKKNHPFEDVVEDEPVYFLLEGKNNLNAS